MNVQGFSPLITSPEILILGTAPSIKSLEHQQYYAHPQNAFWWIMSELYSFDLNMSYQERVKSLTKNRVAVWDVLASCEREGSLDSHIQKEVPNDIFELLNKYPRIKMIGCNGGAALRLLKKYFPALFEDVYHILPLPSTSPAYASMRKEEKLEKWSLIKEHK